MNKEDKETYCSQLAHFYFNKTKFKKYFKGELSGSYIAVSVIEDLCERGIRDIPKEDLINKIITVDTKREDFLKRRAKSMIHFGKDPRERWPHPLLEETNGIITIL